MKRIFLFFLIWPIFPSILCASESTIKDSMRLLDAIKNGPSAMSECWDEKEEEIDTFDKLSPSPDKNKDWQWLKSLLALDPLLEKDPSLLELELMLVKMQGTKNMLIHLDYGKCKIRFKGAWGLNSQQTALKVAGVDEFEILRPKKDSEPSAIESKRFGRNPQIYLPIVSIKKNPGINEETFSSSYLDPVREKVNEIKRECR